MTAGAFRHASHPTAARGLPVLASAAEPRRGGLLAALFGPRGERPRDTLGRIWAEHDAEVAAMAEPEPEQTERTAWSTPGLGLPIGTPAPGPGHYRTSSPTASAAQIMARVEVMPVLHGLLADLNVTEVNLSGAPGVATRVVFCRFDDARTFAARAGADAGDARVRRLGGSSSHAIDQHTWSVTVAGHPVDSIGLQPVRLDQPEQQGGES